MKNDIVSLVRDTLVEAGSTFRADKKDAYRKAIDSKELENEMKTRILQNRQNKELI